MTDITVVIPVGPEPQHKRWLGECLRSVQSQDHRAFETILVDDMAGISMVELMNWLELSGTVHRDLSRSHGIRTWQSPWHLGVPSAFNFGVALARTELVFMLGSDDTMDQRCLKRCADTYEETKAAGLEADLCYYYVGVDYIDDKWPAQFTPCGEAMVSKTLWRATGGFPVESSVGMCDHVFSTMLHGKDVCRWVGVAEGHSLVHYRSHPESDTEIRRGLWHPIATQVMNVMAETWSPPAWGRFE